LTGFSAIGGSACGMNMINRIRIKKDKHSALIFLILSNL